MGPAEVKERYGIPPKLVPDLIALRGDPSDGIPGAKGVGEKTAVELLRKRGSLEKVLDAAVDIMRSDMASMQVVDERENALRLLTFRGFDPEFGKVFELCGPDTRTSCSVARRTGGRVIVSDVETCDFIVGTPALPDHRG